MRAALVVGLLLGMGGAASAAESCVSYEPEIVTLTGVVHQAVAYGPPGFGETPATDSREHYDSLTLDQPLCVLQGDDEMNEAESGVRQVQLTHDGPRYRNGQRVRATGTLFHRFTGHHHTKVLLAVTRLDP